MFYGIVDCNSFYAACERAFNPSLKDQPIVVLSNNDGCVIARSREVKQYTHIPMGAPAFQYQKQFVEQNIAVFSSNYALYGDMSSRVMEIIAQYVDDMEVYSIDEAFFTLEDCTAEKAQWIGSKIRMEILRQLGLPVSVGIASSKALAKLANHIVKKYPSQTEHVYVISTESQRIKALKWVNIEDVWGIGRGTVRKLHALNITKAYEFTQLSDALVKKRFSIVGLRLKKDLEGIATIGFEDIKDKRNIATTRSFPDVLSDLREIEERVATFANHAAEKMRQQSSECSGAYVFLRNNKYHSNDYLKLGGMVFFGFYTSSSIVITKKVIEKLRLIYKQGYTYKKAGVVLVGLQSRKDHQLCIFEDESPQHKVLMKTIDDLNHKYGGGKLKLANQDIVGTWKMRQEHLSPQYTTRFQDIIKVKCF